MALKRWYALSHISPTDASQEVILLLSPLKDEFIES